MDHSFQDLHDEESTSGSSQRRVLGSMDEKEPKSQSCAKKLDAGTLGLNLVGFVWALCFICFEIIRATLPEDDPTYDRLANGIWDCRIFKWAIYATFFSINLQPRITRKNLSRGCLFPSLVLFVFLSFLFGLPINMIQAIYPTRQLQYVIVFGEITGWIVFGLTLFVGLSKDTEKIENIILKKLKKKEFNEVNDHIQTLSTNLVAQKKLKKQVKEMHAKLDALVNNITSPPTTIND